MIHFVVVTGSLGAVARLAPLLPHALHATRHFNGAAVQHRAVSGAWAAAAINQPDPICGERIAATDEAMVVINGPVLTTRADPSRLAGAVLDELTATGTTTASASLAGGYNVVSVAPPTGLRASVDFSGTTPLYWSEGDDVAVFSNRTSTIAALTGSEEWDLRALGWLLSRGTLHGERMPRLGVRHLPPGREAKVAWCGSHVEIGRSPDWIWPAPSTEPAHDNLTPAEWDSVTEELVANFRALRSLEPPIRLWLSGGKDSRLCLGLSKAAELDDLMEINTIGASDGVEVQCALAAAGAVGFDDVRVVQPTLRSAVSTVAGATNASEERRSDRWWRRLRQHAYRYDAIVDAWDGRNSPTTETSLNLRGIGGELYRRGNNKAVRHTKFASTEELAEIYRKRTDPLHILRPEEAVYQDEWRTAWLERAASQVRLDALPEHWYVAFRLSHWNGPLAQSKPGYINVVPLLWAASARKNLELSPTERGSDRLHFEVMRRVAPELVTVPFAEDAWAPGIAASTTMELPPAPVPAMAAQSVPLKRQGKFDDIEQEAVRIDQLLEDAQRETRMEDICDVSRLRAKVRRAEQMRTKGKHQVYGAIGIALALLGRAEPAIDDLGSGESG